MKILYPLAKRFIAGHTFDSAKPSIQKLIDQGYEVSIDYIGENSDSLTQCESAYNQYVEVSNFYKGVEIDISIKPTHLGLKINPHFSYDFTKRLAKLAKKNNHTIRLDMEDSSVTELTRNLAMSLNKLYGNVGVALQANLKRTRKDIKILIDSNVSIRLVKGAYKENSNISTQNPERVEDLFFNYAADLALEGANKPAIATHDESMLEDICEMIPYSNEFDYEFLYGVRRDLQKKLKNKGHKVRIYVPFGEDWLSYTLRRLKEWKNLKFVLINIIKEAFKR